MDKELITILKALLAGAEEMAWALELEFGDSPGMTTSEMYKAGKMPQEIVAARNYLKEKNL